MYLINLVITKECLSYDVASESVITLCIKNGNPLVDYVMQITS